MLTCPAVLAALTLNQRAKAATLYWDINGTTADGSSTTTASGTWNATNTLWNTDLTGGAGGTVGAWTAGSVADFSAGSNVTGASTITISGTQSIGGITFEEGTPTLTGGTLSLNGTQTWLLSVPTASRAATINSTVTGNVGTTGLTIVNNAAFVGTLTLGGNNSGLTGKIHIGSFSSSSSSVVDIIPTTDTALGASGAGNEIDFVDPSGGTASRISLGGGRNINKNVTLTGGGNGQGGHGNLRTTAGLNTWSGSITLNSAGSSSGNNLSGIGALAGSTLVTTGVISGSGKYLAKLDPGTLVLAPQSGGNPTPNTYGGGTRLFGGTIEVWGNGALGSTTGDDLFSSDVYVGAFGGQGSTVLAFRAPPTGPNAGGFNYSDDKQIFLTTNSGATADQASTVANYGGNNTFGGDIIFGGAPQLIVDIAVGSSLQVNGGLWANIATANRTINKIDGGELILTRANNATNGVTSAPTIGAQFALTDGNFNVKAGTLTLRGAGTLNGGIAINMSAATTLNLDSTTTAVNNRIPATTNYSMIGSNLNLLGNATTSVSQTMASLSFDGGMSTITVGQPTTANASTTSLAVTGTLGRTAANRGTGLILGIDNTNGILTVAGGITGMNALGGGGGVGSTTISILPAIVGDNSPTGGGSDFVTLDGTHVRTLASNEYQELSVDDGLQTVDNAKVSTSTSISSTADTQVNALKLTSGTSLNIGAGHRLTVTSGAVVVAGTTTSTLTGGNLAFEQYYAVGVQSPTDMNDLTVGAYATNPADWSPGNPAMGISDGADQTSAAKEAVVTVPTGGLLIQDPTNVISGAAGLTKSGGGTLRLQGTNTFGGIKHFYYYDGGGVDEFGPTSATAAGPLTINAGRVEFNSDANLGYALSSVVINGGTLAPLQTTSSSRPINVGNLGNSIIDVAPGVTFTTSGQISGTVLNKNGAGILALTNTTNNYTGGTMINAGYMELLTSSPTQAEFGAGTVTLNGGSVRADDNLVLDRSVVSISSNTTGGFYIAAGKTLTFGSSSASTAGISGSGNIAIDGGGTLLLAKSAGTSAQMSYTGSLIVNNGSTLDFVDNGGGNVTAGLGGTPNNSATWVILNNNSRLRFDVTSNLGSDFSGGTRGITVNSTGGIIDIAGSNTVINTAGIFGTGTVTKDDTGLYSLRVANNSFSGKWNVLQGTLEFGAPSNDALSLGVGSGADFITIQNGATLRQTTTATTGTMGANQGITLAGATATIDVASTSLTIPSDITAGSGKTLNKIGTGSLSIKNYRGDTLNVNAGNVKIIAGGTSASTSKMNTLSVAASSTLDLTNNKLVLSSMPVGANTFPYTGVTAMVKTGQGTITAGAPTWNGTGGISTSDAGAVNSIAKTLAVAAASDVKNITGAQTALFGGQTVSATDTLVMYTWGGDADLSGKIDADDYFRIDSHYNKSGTVFGYSSGDFNYDGVINGDDYYIIDSNYLASQANPISPGSAFDPSGGASISGVAAVPEPAGLSLLALTIGMASRRRRRS